MQLAKTTSDELDGEINRLDALTTGLAQLIIKPSPLTQLAIRVIHWRECKEVRSIISALR